MRARETADNTFTTDLGTERTERIAADTALRADLTTEMATREANDARLATQLQAEVTARTTADQAATTALNNEITARTDGDLALRNDLNNEMALRAEADTLLRTDLTNEATTREANDLRIQTNLDREATLRAQGDTATQDALTAERTERIAADNLLRTDLTTEATTRAANDTALETAIGNESTARITSDEALQRNIDAEVVARQNAVQGLDTRLSTQFTAEVAARRQEDVRLNDAIAAIRLGNLPPIQQVLMTPLRLTLDANGAITSGDPIPLDANGLLNGVPVVANQRLLLLGQTDSTQNRVIIIDDPAAGTYHFAPDNYQVGSQLAYTSAGTYQGYSWVLNNMSDPVEGRDPLMWSELISPDRTRGDGTYTELRGNVIGFVPQSAALLFRQIGILPPLVYVLGDGGVGGTIMTDSATGDSYVIVDYTPRVMAEYPILTNLPGTLNYYSTNARYVDSQSYLAGVTVSPINQNQVRVDFVGLQPSNSVVLVLGGVVNPLV
jgi:hypothetical protein